MCNRNVKHQKENRNWLATEAILEEFHIIKSSRELGTMEDEDPACRTAGLLEGHGLYSLDDGFIKTGSGAARWP